MLYREPMWLKRWWGRYDDAPDVVSVLYREPMWLKRRSATGATRAHPVSVLYREPMWLKLRRTRMMRAPPRSFSALP